MCLILAAWRAHPQYPLVIAARSSAVLVVGRNNEVFFDEKEWNPDASQNHRQRFKFTLEKPDHGRAAY